VINRNGSERGWQGRRRIAVLVSIVAVLGVVVLGSASSASAATVANCNAKLKPQGGNGTKAKLSFSCDAPIRAYSVASNKPIKDYTNPSGGNGFFTCEGSGAGFGCGVSDRATPGFQNPGTTGWGSVFPPAPSATAIPTTCGGFTRTATNPNRNSIVGAPCTEVLTPGTTLAQQLKLKQSPCAGGKKNPFQLFLLVGGEPAVTSIVAGTTLESTTVGEYLQAPIKVSTKKFKCKGGTGNGNGKGGGGKKSVAAPSHFPVGCAGSVSPFNGVVGPDVKVSFTCNQNIRAFAIYSNKSIDLPGDEPVVTGTSGGGVNEGALHQCEGDIPGPGYGCGIVDRQTQSTALPNGQGISGGNNAEQKMGFDVTPCKRSGEPKTKVWLVVMGEPLQGPYAQGGSSGSVGEFSSQPFQLPLTGYGKCKGGKKK
jgi:hypothetical protein